MTGPSPQRLSSPRRGHDIGYSIWVHFRACWLNNWTLRPRPWYNTQRVGDVKTTRHSKGGSMNLTLLAGLLCLVLWLVLVFGAHLGSGTVQLLWAAAIVLIARRVLAGAPKFLS